MKSIFLILLYFFYSNIVLGQGIANQRVYDTLSNYQSATCLVIYDGSYTCTGTLLNNTTQDGRLLILSTAHCIDDPGQIESVVIVFGRQRLVQSSNISGLEWRSSFGAELLTFCKELDYALLELNQELPDEIMPQFMGWDRSGKNISTSSSIHHPDFDFKEMAHSRTGVQRNTFNGLENTVKNGHWKVSHWTFGETVIGSSGAALLDQQLRVVGGLSGSTISGDQVSDFFFRFDRAWNFSVDENLQQYLDKAHTQEYVINSISFSELRDLNKISSYQFSDSLGESFFLERDNVLTQKITSAKQGDLTGVYLPVGRIGADLLNTITISFLSSGSVIHIEEVSLFKLDENEENYISFLSEIPFKDDLEIDINLNSNLEGEFIEFPQTQDGNVLISVLSRFSKFEIELPEIENDLSLFPNPSTGYMIVDEIITSATTYDQNGSLKSVGIEQNAFGQTVLDLTPLASGIHYMKLVTKDNILLVEKVIKR